MKKLAKYFYLYHIHSNNNSGRNNRAGFDYFEVLEGSYIRKDLVKDARIQVSMEYFPTDGIDTSNNANGADHQLNVWPFYNDEKKKIRNAAGFPI